MENIQEKAINVIYIMETIPHMRNFWLFQNHLL